MSSIQDAAHTERTPLLRMSSDASLAPDKFDIYPLLMRIRSNLCTMIDTPLSPEQLASPRIALSIIRPLEDEYYALCNPAIIYCLFVARVHFIKSSSTSYSQHSINGTRAALCEILAGCVLRRIADEQDNEGTDPARNLLKLANVLARNYDVWQGAPKSVLPEDYEVQKVKEGLTTLTPRSAQGQTSALELAIVTHAKNFIRSQPCQKVVQGIYEGQITYSAVASYHVLPDNYKRKPITLYDPSKAPFLDHYRLQVPRIRATLEGFYFFVLFFSYFVVLETRHINNPPNIYEWWFIIYGSGFALDKFASTLEHGWQVFASNLWNSLDAMFCVAFSVYLILLAQGDYLQHHDVLSCAAIFLLPRLVFLLLSDNLMVLAIRAMLGPFVFLMCLAMVCFSGFLYSLWLLGGKEFSLSQISENLVLIWFGLDGRAFDEAQDFHPVLGPIIYFLYACLSNTLLVTILVAILTAVFANIDRDTTAEVLYRRTVVIFQGIKADGLFNYQPPMNLLALIFLVPIRLFLTQRKFHSLNVLCTRICSGPVLVAIAIFEGRHKRFLPQNWRNPFTDSSLWPAFLASHFWNPRRDIDLVFEGKCMLEDVDSEISNRKEDRLSVHGKASSARKTSHRLSGLRSPTPGSKPFPPAPHFPRQRRESALASIYAPSRLPSNFEAVSDGLKERLDNIEEVQRGIQEALNALLGADSVHEAQ